MKVTQRPEDITVQSLQKDWAYNVPLNRHRSLCPGDRPSLIWSFAVSLRRSLFIYLLFFTSKVLAQTRGPAMSIQSGQRPAIRHGLCSWDIQDKKTKKKEPWSQKSAWPSGWMGFTSSSPKARLSSGHQWVSFWISYPQWSSAPSQCSISPGLTVTVLSCVWSMWIVITVSQQMPESRALRWVLHFLPLQEKKVSVSLQKSPWWKGVWNAKSQRCNLSGFFFSFTFCYQFYVLHCCPLVILFSIDSSLFDSNFKRMKIMWCRGHLRNI